jgi:hypothetical protein
MPFYILIEMRKKPTVGELFFTVADQIVDFYCFNGQKSVVYKLPPGTPVVICESAHTFETKIGGKTIPLEVDVDVWIPVFYCGFIGWIYREDINFAF